jgi:probable rRNA maturation factor
MSVGFYQQSITTSILKGEKRKVASWIKNFVEKEHKKTGSISIILTNKKVLLAINKQHLNHDYHTDIITFNYNDGKIISGDLFISIDRIKENAETFNVTLKQELFRVIIHGILHLLGYNDATEKERQEIRKKEDGALKLIP